MTPGGHRSLAKQARLGCGLRGWQSREPSRPNWLSEAFERFRLDWSVFIVYFCGLAFDRKNHGVTLRVGLAHSKHKVAVRHIGGHPEVDLIQTDGARS